MARLPSLVLALTLGVGRGWQAPLRLWHARGGSLTMRGVVTGPRWDPGSDADVDAARALGVWPLDGYNAALLDEVRPRDWREPAAPPDVYDLVVIGAGAGGLVSAKQAARRGARSCMISEALAGGDCLNVGCVPSKALLRAARAVREVRRAAEFGVVLSAPPRVDFDAVMRRLREKRASIAPADSHAGTAATGADVFQGRGRFTGPHTVSVNGRELRFRRAIVATGGRAFVPPVPGLADGKVPYLTNADLFNLEALPRRLAILGAGAVGLEMAQAFATFGSEVTVVARSPALLRGEPPAAAAALRAALERDGVRFVLGADVTRAEAVPGAAGGATAVVLSLAAAGGGAAEDAAVPRRVECDVLLVASGRVPNTEDLGLDRAGVALGADGGVAVDDALRTSNPDVFAVGDCVAGAPRLTHAAGEMAKVAVQNALFDGDWRFSSLVVPRCIYTEPELASVGRGGEELAAAEEVGEVKEYLAPLAGNDRAILEGEECNGGFALVRADAGTGAILGATVLAGRAGEIINEVTLAMKNGLGMEALGRNIHPYPTTAEAVMACGLQWINARWKTMGESSEPS